MGYQTPMFVAALFTISQRWKPPKCPSTGKQIKYSIYTQWNIVAVVQLCPTLCDPMDCSTPGLPVLHYLLEFA